MSHFIIVYASHEGQTQKVAHHVAKQVENLGHIARLINVGDEEEDAMAGEFDAAIIAGDLDSSNRASALAEFVDTHRASLQKVPSALLSVTLEAAVEGTSGLKAVQDDIETFEEATGLRPDRTLPVAGAFHDRSHGGIVRAFRHVWMHLKGITPDPSGHTELTDWKALETFIRDFASDAASGKVKTPAAGSSKKKTKRSATAKSAQPKRAAPQSKKPG